MYRTRSDTQKLQRLIDFLKERGSDSAANLETSAADFLNDVKPKYGPGDIPYYDGDNSSAGSSFVEEKQTEQDDDWDDDWEEWEDCAEELTEMVPEVVPPRIPTPPPRIPTPTVIVETPPPPSPEVVPIIVVKSSPPQNIPEIKTIPTKSPLVIPTKSPKPSPSPSTKSSRYKPSVVLSGVEKSSDVATPLIKFPTLPVSIPNFFSNGNSDNDNSKNGNGKKDKKKNKVPEDAVESVLVDSMTVAAALVVPQIDPSLAQTKAKEAAKEEQPPECPTIPKETETLHASPILGSFKSEPMQIRKLSRQDSIDYCSDHSDCQDSKSEDLSSSVDNLRSKSVDLSSSETDSSRKSPLRSILKKTPSRTSLNSPSPSPKFEVSFANPIANCEALESITETIPEHMILYDLPEVVSERTESDLDLDIAKIQPHPAILESEPKSKLTELMKRSESPKKQISFQLPKEEEKVNEEPSKLKPSKILKSPKPKRKNTPMLPLQPLQYNVPDDAKLLKVGGQRSRKPTLASQWRMQKERQKQEEQGVLDRFNTFEDWPFPHTSEPFPQELADAGFFYMGLNDCVQCPYCEILLSGWSEMEDKRPWIQHAKTSPGCPYLERTKGSAWVQESLKS